MSKDRIGDRSKTEIQALVRDYRLMINEFLALTEVFPQSEDLDNPHYWHVRLPKSSSFIDSSETPASIRRMCIQALIDRTQYLIDIRPKSKASARVVADINLPRLSNSGIIVFFDEEYFYEIFKRDICGQGWLTLPTCRGLEREWVVSVPDKLSVEGFQEEISEEGFIYKREFWFVGDI